MSKTPMTQSKEMEEFDKMWERDFSQPSPGNPNQWVMLSNEKYKQFISSNFIPNSEIESKIMKAEIEQCRNIHKLNGNIDQRYLIDRQELLNSLLKEE